MKIYNGYRTLTGTALVMVTDQRLKPYNFSVTRSQKVWNHSPDGFEWGYGGSGPAQLALAILLDVTGDEKLASRWHQDYKRDVIALLPKADWKISEREVWDWLHGNEKEEHERKTESDTAH